MSHPQPAIFTEGCRSHYALEYVIAGSGPSKVREAVKAALDGAAKLADVLVTVAFGPDLWKSLAGENAPNEFRHFQAIGDEVPATGGDIFFWLQGPAPDVVFEAVLAIQTAMSSVADVFVDQAGFVYKDSRDLTGFVDGSANPKDDNRQLAALIQKGKKGAGGAFVLTQKWVHNLSAFNRLPQAEQEGVIGRTKPDSIELEDEAMPATSHVSRTDVKVDGVAQKIYRRSFPYGSAKEHGLYFMAFGCELSRFQIQLDRMFGVTKDGLRDRITEFSKPVTGAYWFAPSVEGLERAL